MYTASKERYTTMEYDHCGNSGLMLPKVSLGLWHNFGDNANFENMRKLCFTAFDNGITQFDLANNYGPEPCLLYTSPSPRDRTRSRMQSSA